MALPAPTMGERELEDFVRGGGSASGAGRMDVDGSGATGGLLGEYSDESTRGESYVIILFPYDHMTEYFTNLMILLN